MFKNTPLHGSANWLCLWLHYSTMATSVDWDGSSLRALSKCIRSLQIELEDPIFQANPTVSNLIDQLHDLLQPLSSALIHQHPFRDPASSLPRHHEKKVYSYHIYHIRFSLSNCLISTLCEDTNKALNSVVGLSRINGFSMHTISYHQLPLFYIHIFALFDFFLKKTWFFLCPRLRI